MTKNLVLDFYGSRIGLKAEGEIPSVALQDLAMDFEHFVAEKSAGKSDPDFSISIHVIEKDGQERTSPRGTPLFTTRMCRVYGWGNERVCDYGNGLIVHAKNQPTRRKIHVSGKSREELREILYMLLLSISGEALDERGIHRVHALGFQLGRRTALLLADAGVGKSSLAALLLRETKAGIYSDETPLLHGMTLIPFPIRLALKPELQGLLAAAEPGSRFSRKIFPEKILFPIPQDRIAKEAELDLIFLARRSSGPPRIRRAGRFAVFAELLRSMVVGIGVAQMAEHLLRLPSTHRLIGIALSRLRTAVRISWTAQGHVLELGSDPQTSLAAVTALLSAE